MKEIYNGTQHEINFYALDDCYSIENGRKLVAKEGAKPYLTIPSGKNLDCKKGNADPTVTAAVPIKGAVIFLECDRIPEEAEGKIVIVSNLYRSAMKELGFDTSLLATIDGTVYESEDAKRPCGCLNLAVG